MAVKAAKTDAKLGTWLWYKDHGDWVRVTVTEVTKTPKGVKVSWVDEQGMPGKALLSALYRQT